MKEENVVNYYVLCNKFKNVIRTGWKDWHVKKERIESVAEHIYGTQMLAIGIYSEYHYDLDIMKVIYMLAIHELGEIIIGDYTPFDITKEEKEQIEHEAVTKVLSSLMDKDKINMLFLEFDSHETKESMFAYECDKLECDIQCKLYDEEECVDINSKENQNEFRKKELEQNKSWSYMWITHDLDKLPYDDNFRKIATYVRDNEVL